MKNNFRRRRPRTSPEEGQTFIPIVVLIALLLLGMMGVAIDYSQLWAHRQMAQGAADAACQAGAADLYLKAVDPTASGAGGLEPFTWIGAAFDCGTKAGTPPCQYANVNGYSGAAVAVSFPASVPNAPALPGSFGTTTNYIQVTITDQVQMSLTRLLSPNPNVTIKATAACGLVPVTMPTPLVILHSSAAGALSVQGSSKIIIVGGPQRSVQVNSRAAAAINVGSVDLSAGGPNGTGSDFAVFGGPKTQPGSILLGTTGNYIYPALPLTDPFAGVNPPPESTTTPGSVRPVPFGVNGCPDPNGCVEFTAGDYKGCTSSGNINPGDQGCLLLPYKGSNPGFTAAGNQWVASTTYASGTLIQPSRNKQGNAGLYVFMAIAGGTSGTATPNFASAAAQTPCVPQSNGTCSGGTVTDGTQVTWQNVGKVTLNQLTTGIFDPGVFFVAANGLNFGDNSTARVSTATGDGSKGVMFYFSTAATVAVTSNSGKSAACTSASNTGAATPNGCVVSYQKSGAVSTQANGYLPSQKLQCPAGSTDIGPVPAVMDGNVLLGPCAGNFASPDGNRGFLFFQNRATSAQPSWGGGGQFLSSGFMYFHSGNGATCGTSTSCLTLQGGSGSQSFTLGNIVVDELALGGNPKINMILNPAATFSVVKPTLLE